MSNEIKKAKNLCSTDSIALKPAANRIEKFHKKQMPKNTFYKDKEGMNIKTRRLPLEKQVFMHQEVKHLIRARS